MLTSRTEILLQVVLGVALLGFIYLGVERLWITKVNAQIQAQQFRAALQQCVAAQQSVEKK